MNLEIKPIVCLSCVCSGTWRNLRNGLEMKQNTEWILQNLEWKCFKLSWDDTSNTRWASFVQEKLLSVCRALCFLTLNWWNMSLLLLWRRLVRVRLTTDCDKPEAARPQHHFFLLYYKNSSAECVSEDILDEKEAEQLQINLNPTMFFRSFQKRLVVSEASDLHQVARI